MLFTKTRLYRKHNVPIDFGKKYKDGAPIFGENKTYIGFVSMIFFCIIFQCLMGIVCCHQELQGINALYYYQENSLLYNLTVGFSVGFLYVISELPNSFVKRRLSIAPGKTSHGVVGLVFFIIDQIDSLLLVMLYVCWLGKCSFLTYLLYLFLGFVTHIFVNLILYFIKIRRNI